MVKYERRIDADGEILMKDSAEDNLFQIGLQGLTRKISLF